MSTPGATPLSPDRVLNPKDPGDATRRQNRYQDIRAACYVPARFDDEEEIVEIACEQQEGVPVKRATSRSRGVPIETKEDRAVPSKAVDEEVVKSLQRFVEEEREFPSQFEQFVLGRDCGLRQEKKNGSNLPHLLDSAKGKTRATAPKPVLDSLRRLCPAPGVPKAPKVKKPKQTADAALSPNATASNTVPPVGPTAPRDPSTRNARADDRQSLERVPEGGGHDHAVPDRYDRPPIGLLAGLERVGRHQPYDGLDAIAEALLDEAAHASAMGRASLKRNYFEVCEDSESAKADCILAAKRFDRARAEGIIRTAFRARTPLADGTAFSADNLPAGTRTRQAQITIVPVGPAIVYPPPVTRSDT